MHHERVIAMMFSMLLGCASSADDELAGPDKAELQESQLAISSAALENGPPWFGGTVQVELSERAPLHAWTFELTHAASVTFATRGTATGPDVDTVLYLYRWGSRGWGAHVARNDNHAGTVFSALSRNLQAGRYRVVVKGRTPQAIGPLAVRAECSGDGCRAPEPAPDCVFGQLVTDIPALLRASHIMTVTSGEELPNDLMREQLVASAAQVPGTSMATVSELFPLVDGGLVRWMRVWDDAGARQFIAYEFRVADSSYGALFDQADGELAARVADARVTDCRVPAGRCVLGASYQELQRNPRFEMLSTVRLDLQSASSLSEREQAQLLEAVHVAYADAEDLAAAFEAVDGNLVNHVVLDEISGDRGVAVFEYGAGENSYGGVFSGPDLAPIARIEDGALNACAWIE